jgi:hypothetical protein
MRGALLLLLAIALGPASIACDQGSGQNGATPPVYSVAGGTAENVEPRLATRRNIAGCDANEAARAYRAWVGRDVDVKLLWNDLPDAAANLRIPMGIRSVVEGGLAVRLANFPLQTYYVNLWANSGHLRVVDDDLVLDPCSAEIAANPSMYGAL